MPVLMMLLAGLPSGQLRNVDGFGKLWIPNRLEAPLNQSDDKDCIRIVARRYYPWYRFDAMGSFTPVREGLFIEIGANCGNWATGEAMRAVQPRDLAGQPPFRVAEGVYTENTLKDKVVVVELRVPEKNAVIAYRAWKSDASIEDAKQIVQQVARSLK